MMRPVAYAGGVLFSGTPLLLDDLLVQGAVGWMRVRRGA